MSTGAAGTGAGSASLEREAPDARAPGRPDLLVLCVLAAGIALRFLALGQQSLWHDEIHSIANALEGGGNLSHTLLDVHGPLYLLLLKGWMRLFGQAEVSVRALSAILGSVGLVLFYRLTLRVAGRRAGVIALALLAFSPFYLWYSQEARNYVLLFDLGLLAVPAFMNDVERRTPATFMLALLATAATCLSNLVGLFLLALAGCYALTAGRSVRYPVRRLLLFALLTAVILSPWILKGANLTGRLHLGPAGAGGTVLAVKGESPPGILSIPFTFYEFSLGLSLGPSVDALKMRRLAAVVPHLWYLLPAGAIFLYAAYLGIRRATRSVRLLLGIWIGLPVLLMAGLSVLNLKAANSRYAFLAFAPYVMLLAVGVNSVRTRVLRLGLLAALLCVSLSADYRYFTDREYWKPDARSAGQLLTREARPEDAVIVYVLDYPLRHYIPEQMALLLPGPGVFTSEASVRSWLAANTSRHPRVWIVQCQGWWVDREDRFVGVCRKTMTAQGEWQFTRMPVYLFTQAGAAGEGTR